jgi:hypothetical protein
MARPLPAGSIAARNGSASKLTAAQAEAGLEPVDAGWDDEETTPANAPSGEEADLRERLADTERQLVELRQDAELALQEQQTEFERILEEKIGLIRELHQKVTELEARPVPAPQTPREEELLALSEELERERKQLKEDEEALMEQMGQMEVQMSRERAELARQRTELQRLQSEIRHELELAARDAALRERLAPLQRRQQEITARRSTGATPPPGMVPPAPVDTGADADPAPSGSGLFRRLFG